MINVLLSSTICESCKLQTFHVFWIITFNHQLFISIKLSTQELDHKQLLVFLYYNELRVTFLLHIELLQTVLNLTRNKEIIYRTAFYMRKYHFEISQHGLGNNL